MSREMSWMCICFLWFLAMVVPYARTQSTNMTYKFGTTGDICCLERKQQDALRQAAMRVAQCLISNTQHGAGDTKNNTEGSLSEQFEGCKHLVSVMNMNQTKVNKTENTNELHEPLHNFELDEEFFQSYEDFNKCSCVVCLVATFGDKIIYRYNDSTCHYICRCNAPEGQKSFENILVELKYIKYNISRINVTDSLGHKCAKIFLDVINCDTHSRSQTATFPLKHTALRSKGEDIYFGITYREVGGISGFVILASIYITGLVLNCILIRIFIRHDEMRKDSKLIIINIAVADMLNLTLHNPPIDIFLVNSIHSPLSVTYVFYMIVGLNIYSVMMFSCHIYLTLLPVINRRNSSCNSLGRYSPHAHALTAALLACLVPVPLISVIEEYYTVSLYVLIAYCAVPLCCSTLFSVGTSLKLGSCVQSVQCGSTDHETLRGSRSKSANTLVALIVVSAVSYVPYFCLPFIPPYIGEQSDDHPFLIPWVFVWFNSLINPIALYVADRNFRYYFNKYICFCCCNARD